MAPAIGWTRLLAAALIAVALPVSASAQYFGANKVQYTPLHFRVLHTEHFDIYFHQEEREAVDVAGRLAERWWTRLSRFFGHELSGRQSLVLYRSHVDFEQTLIVPHPVDARTGGLTESWRRRIAMPFAGPLAQTDRVIGHELVHAFQFDIQERGSRADGERRAVELPLWFVEGLAEYVAVGDVDAHTAMWLRDAVRLDDLPRIDELQRPRYFAYRWGHAFWAYVGARWGDGAASKLFTAASRLGVSPAVEQVLGVTDEEFVTAWHAAIRAAYLARPAAAAPVGAPVIAGRSFVASSNVGPAMSPDGRWLAFLSEHAFFSIDLFVADARSGKVVAKLTDTAGDRHYSNLQFIDSVGAWDRDGRRLAVATVTAGRPAVWVFGWPGGSRQFDIVVDDVDEIYSPTWSPDGRSIAFSALSNGVTDLFVYDVERSSLRRLTHDVFADMQPAWEPQGRRIAFVTDRFTTDTRALTLGEYRLALIDADTGTIHAVPAFETGKHISPQWSPDGQSLYFISDSDGTSDLYRVELVDGGIRRLSVAMTGLSGFAASSPVLSVATRDGAVAVTLYESGRFAIHTLNPDAGTQVVADSAPFVVPSPLFGAPDRSALSRWPADAPASPWSEPTASSYKPRLSFEGVTQAAVTVGMDRFGAMAGTGIGVVFSDVLNTRSVAAVVQPNQALQNGLRLRETAAYGVYINRVHRWNWGAIGSVVPTLAGIRSAQAVSSVSLPDPSPVSLFRQTERATTAIAAYPFDRLRRIELQAGIGRVTFEPIAAEQSRPGLAPAPLTQEHAAAAFVSDVTNAGLTSVLHGERYRLEVAQTFGTIRYVTALADYRRYVMPVPFYTIAMRAFHFGRYGSGADDPRVPPLYLGYPALVRGFDLRSRVIDDCAAASSRCQDVDRMLGSRVAVANLELRFPILRPFGISPRMYGPLQSEVAVFVDGGLAWRKAGPSHATVWGRGVWSTGVTLRTNVLGLGLAQFDMARRLRIPGAGWVFQFNLTPAL